MLYGARPVAKRQVYMICEVPEMDHKKLFFYDVVERKPFVFTSGKDCVRFQLHLLKTFLKGGGQLWLLDELWTQLGFLTGSTTSSSYFSWSQEHTGVCEFALVAVLYIGVVIPLI